MWLAHARTPPPPQKKKKTKKNKKTKTKTNQNKKNTIHVFRTLIQEENHKIKQYIFRFDSISPFMPTLAWLANTNKNAVFGNVHLPSVPVSGTNILCASLQINLYQSHASYLAYRN